MPRARARRTKGPGGLRSPRTIPQTPDRREADPHAPEDPKSRGLGRRQLRRQELAQLRRSSLDPAEASDRDRRAGRRRRRLPTARRRPLAGCPTSDYRNPWSPRSTRLKAKKASAKPPKPPAPSRVTTRNRSTPPPPTA